VTRKGSKKDEGKGKGKEKDIIGKGKRTKVER